MTEKYWPAVALAIAYFAAALIAFSLANPANGIVGIWAGNAMALIFLLRRDPGDWPFPLAAVSIAGFAACWARGYGEAASAGIAVANLVEIGFAAGILRQWFGRTITFERRIADHLSVLFVAAAVAPGISSILVAMVLQATQGAPPLLSFWSWWGGSAVGSILVLPLALAASPENLRLTFSRAKGREVLAFAVVSPIVMAVSVAFVRYPLALFCVPLVAAALRTNPFATASITAISVGVLALCHFLGLLPLANVSDATTHGPVTVFASFALLMPYCISLLIEQQRQEKARISESEARFRNAMEYSAIGIALVGTDGRFLKVNPALCTLLGYATDELQSLTFQEITHPDDLSLDLDHLNRVLRGEIDNYRMEKRYHRRNGELVWARLAVSCVREKPSGAVLYFISQVEDITAQKEANARLEASESRWSFALESARQGVWDYDVVAQKTFYSPVWKAILGYAEDEVSSDAPSWLDFVHPDDVAILHAAVAEHLAGRRDFFECEFRMRHKDGRWIWILDRGRAIERDAGGAPTRFIGTHTDITERKEAEAAIAQLSQRMQLAVKAGGVGLWEFNPSTREMWWDGRMRELYGAKAGELAGSYEDWLNRIHPDDRERVARAGRVAFSGGDIYDTQFRIVLPTGEIRHIHAQADLVRGADGTPRLMVGTNWDITEREMLTEALFHEKERLHITLQSIGDAVISTDTESRITFMNTVAEELTGWLAAEAVGQPLGVIFKIVDEATGESAESPVRACLAGDVVKTSREGLVMLSRKGRRDIRNTAAPVRTPSGAIVGVVLIFQDMTESRNLQRQLTHSATHDALTGLANRVSFEMELRRACADVDGGYRQHAVCFIDLDRFKIVNDTAGHAAGDALLREIGRIIRQNVRAQDVTARLGGDEFGLLLHDCTIEQVEIIAEKMIQSIRSIPFAWDGRTYDIGASIGVTAITASSSVPSELLSQADIACYTAKSLGRNRVAAYRAGESEARRQHRDLQVAARIRGAIETDRFRLYAQEIRALQPLAAKGRHYEILLRMLDEDGSILEPDQFIPAAERYDLMANIDRWVVRAVLTGHAARIAAEPHLSISINLSANSLNDPQFWPFLEGELLASQLTADRLRLEITETALINNLSAASLLVDSAREAGCAIVLDDFGTGLSSFAYLKRFPIDYLKIDGSFMRTLKDNGVDRTIVESINDIAHKLGAGTIAEWVEDAETADILRQLGVDHAQGYAIAPPRPLEEVLLPETAATETVRRRAAG